MGLTAGSGVTLEPEYANSINVYSVTCPSSAQTVQLTATKDSADYWGRNSELGEMYEVSYYESGGTLITTDVIEPPTGTIPDTQNIYVAFNDVQDASYAIVTIRVYSSTLERATVYTITVTKE